MSYIHELNFRKVFGLCEGWVILQTKNDFMSISELCREANVLDPPLPKEYPCLARFWRDEVAEEPHLNAIYVGIYDASEFLKSAGFIVEVGEERRKRVDTEGW